MVSVGDGGVWCRWERERESVVGDSERGWVHVRGVYSNVWSHIGQVPGLAHPQGVAYTCVVTHKP